jgi:hypothetical protein
VSALERVREEASTMPGVPLAAAPLWLRSPDDARLEERIEALREL